MDKSYRITSMSYTELRRQCVHFVSENQVGVARNIAAEFGYDLNIFAYGEQPVISLNCKPETEA